MRHNPTKYRAFALPRLPLVRKGKRKAFTLVELLVVIGIIAILVGVLLPVLSKVQSRGRDLKCQSNIRQILIALRGYVEENRGVFPYGFYVMKTRSQDRNILDGWMEPGSGGGEFVSWASLVTKWMHKGKPGDAENDIYNYHEILKCPEGQQSWPHPLSYVMNMVVGVTPFYDLQIGSPPRAQLRPPGINLMLKDTVLVWDTSCVRNSDLNIGWMIGLDIDNRRFWTGASIPQQRYYSPSDPFAGFGFGNNQPVKLDVGTSKYRNIDPTFDGGTGGNQDHKPYSGNLRFRHQGETACNAGFVDGHVEAFKAKVNSDRTINANNHNALRRYFMIKYPSSVSPDDAFPY